MNNCTYNIGDCCFQLHGDRLIAATQRIPGFEVFTDTSHQVPEFLIIESEEAQVESALQDLYQFESDRVASTFSTCNGGYRLSMQHEDGSSLTLWSRTEERRVYLCGDFSAQLLRFALWMAYSLMTFNTYRIAIHSSCIVNQGKAFLFLGESGTGKSTHTRLWGKYIAGSQLLNDDSPILCVKGEEVWVYGSPWSGKTPCYKQECYPLGGCVRLSQAPFNRIKKLGVLQAFAAIHPSCPPDFAYSDELYDGICRTLDKLIAHVPLYHLACLPDQEAATLSFNTLTHHENH